MLIAPSSTENRVWIKTKAIDAARNQKKSFNASSRKQALLSNNYDSESDVGSVRSSSSSHDRQEPWGWRSGYLIESTGGSVVVRVESQEWSDASSTCGSVLSDDGVVRLAASALNDGDVVLANEYELNEEGIPICPHDLITLTHLHEASVVECLSHRYSQDMIYTFTGPVLLALNPFQALHGLYGEVTMKKYWTHAERKSHEALPPHVYSIADNSFRNMMRKLDEMLEVDEPQGCDQSILVSGESGAGKTVTTKFVMKYLAALSQRSAASRHAPQKRAYLQVEEQRKQQQEKNSNWGNWKANFNLMVQTDGNATGALSSATTLTGSTSNSIEAQVLQSNPILESFGNARTVRNDNSSRFGKFIEIQFTRYGQLVGAKIDTYLLEKVRLVTQSPVERNYHIFFELLSGGMDPRELRQYFIAATATPGDFRITANGVYDRRDGVSDRDTYRALRNAMNTMKFAPAEQKDIFSVAAAILHASNLTFLDLGEESSLDERNVHLGPVCHLLGVTAPDLNQALCYYSIQAGKDTRVERALTLERAMKGLEALLKATYGALFTYLVRRINDSIAYKDYSDPDEEGTKESDSHSHSTLRPVASIGVLDIFGFESFTKNSFEQICINYCNEALQQQFNAFVLKNEQAEYEREGIEWSFIQFPENQDVLDLIEKRGTGILSILDDQCRAPGTSDKSLSQTIYAHCKGRPRFAASRKQIASMQFSVFHYAGPVEYTADGFIEKNRDELPKESTELLKNSMNPFVEELAMIIEFGAMSCGMQGNDPYGASSLVSSSGSSVTKSSRRADSSMVSRTTVGGQFRRQLKDLRGKVDRTAPHYVRCLKPNDHLVPDHFDTSIVAEQLRCGGILEAVRVARAGFTQHYPHNDFIRRYRSLAWKELKQKINVRRAVANSKYAASSSTPAARHKRESPRRQFNRSGSTYQQKTPAIPEEKPTLSHADVKALCRDLIKILCVKVQAFEQEENHDRFDETQSPQQHASTPSPSAKAKSYTYHSSTPSPSWQKKAGGSGVPRPPPSASAPPKSRYSPWEQPSSTSNPPPRHRRTATHADLVKVGIQLGKTKVFLRHQVFETLERMRSTEQTKASTKLNSIFRRYLARLAYIPVRNAYRREMRDHHFFSMDEEFKETKEQDYEDSLFRESFETSFRVFAVDNVTVPLVFERWEWDSQVRAAIHNPIPRHEWGKHASEGEHFKWILKDGIWVKNRGTDASSTCGAE